MTDPRRDLFDPRLPFARLQGADWIRLGATTTLFLLGFSIYHFLGNNADEGQWGRSALVWMVQRWGDSGISMGSGDYSHGFLVPVASLYVVWHRRDTLIQARKSRSLLGLLGVICCLMLHYIGVKGELTRVSLVSLIGLCWTIPFYLYGWQVAKQLIFPCAFLIFAVPLNFLAGVSNRLRLINASISASVLRGLGIDVLARGTAILGPPYDARAILKLDVADPCSGIRSLTAMMALTAIYGNLVMRGFWRKWALFLAGIPLAMAGNIVRIVAIGILSEAINTDIATGLAHDYAGFIVFGIAIGLMVAVSALLNRDLPQLLSSWKQKCTSARI